jgi:predicted transcriptional regulator
MVRGQIVESGTTYQQLAEFLKDHLGVTINKIEDEPTESFKKTKIKEQEENTLTKEEVMEQVQEMASELTGIITRKCKEALGSGALDVEDYKAGDYSLAKLILSVSLKRAAEQYVPLGDKLKKEYKNLLNFV